MTALRFTGGHRRQTGAQAKVETRNATVQTNVSRPQRLNVLRQSHTIGESSQIDRRDMSDCEDSDVGSSDHDNDVIESANDPRRTSNSHGPAIAALDSMDTYSDDSFFDFEKLSHAEFQEETTDNIVHCASDIDSDGDLMPGGEFSSTDDETSTNARVRRYSEKRRI